LKDEIQQLDLSKKDGTNAQTLIRFVNVKKENSNWPVARLRWGLLICGGKN